MARQSHRAGGPSDPSTRDGNNSSGNLHESHSGHWTTDNDTGDDVEDDLPEAGPSGGAVGGTPAGKRSTGGSTGHGISSAGSHRGDSTIGSDPDRPSE